MNISIAQSLPLFEKSSVDNHLAHLQKFFISVYFLAFVQYEMNYRINITSHR